VHLMRLLHMLDARAGGRQTRNKDVKGTSPNSPLPLRIRPCAPTYCTTTCNGMLWTTFTVVFVCERVNTLAVPVTITV
jgi:hypothetical protein